MKSEEKVVGKLIDKKKTVALAESCSGGLLSHRLTNVPGSSSAFIGSVVAYNNDIKQNLLLVPKEILRKFGAVSAETAMAMSLGCRKVFGTDYGIAITGIAGPSGGTKRKPVGLTYIAVNQGPETICLKCEFPGTRAEIKRQATQEALRLLLEFLI